MRIEIFPFNRALAAHLLLYFDSTFTIKQWSSDLCISTSGDMQRFYKVQVDPDSFQELSFSFLNFRMYAFLKFSAWIHTCNGGNVPSPFSSPLHKLWPLPLENKDIPLTHWLPRNLKCSWVSYEGTIQNNVLDVKDANGIMTP